jgi:hypothetical protein
VEILSCVQEFGRALELDLPNPLTTNDVSQFSPYRGFGQVCGVQIHERWQFAFNVKNRFVSSFTDRKHSMIVLRRTEDILPLLKPSKLTKGEALVLARKYLKRLGYSEENSPVLPPVVKPWNWEPAGTNHSEPLPFFTVEWPWKLRPDGEYFTIEVDGLRERVNYFSTAYRSFAELSFEKSVATNSTPINQIPNPKTETISTNTGTKTGR